jgi:predicted nucleic acid-binding protein
MKYVVDVSVALKWVLPEPLADKARQLRDDSQNHIHELWTPDIFPAEMANALTRAERRKIIAVGQATRLLAEAMRTAPKLQPYLPLLTSALSIASQARIAIYDCFYLVLAQQEGCDFITADDRLVRNLQAQFPFIVPLSSLP